MTQTNSRNLFTWHVTQVAAWLTGIAMLAALFISPRAGINAFWNFVILLAPATFMIVPGVWRNICPLAWTTQLPLRLKISRRMRLPVHWAGRLNLIGLFSLFLILPLRRVVLDTNGPATAVTIIVIAATGFIMCMLFDAKSGWCSGLCPIHPVEKLYGPAPAVRVLNAHCRSCVMCVQPCPDSTELSHMFKTRRLTAQGVSNMLITGGLAGFLWGWYRVPDYYGAEGWRHLGEAYMRPAVGFAITMLPFLLLKLYLPKRLMPLLTGIFAAAAISCYYWYRVPTLFGFGIAPGEMSILMDLRHVLPAWFPLGSRALTTSLFVWFLIIRAPWIKRNWCKRPPMDRSVMSGAGQMKEVACS